MCHEGGDLSVSVRHTTAVRASPMEEDAALPARPEAEVVAGGASHKNNHARNRRISVVAASYTHSDPEVAATQRAQLSAIQSRSSSFRGFSEDHLDMLFPLLTIIEVRAARSTHLKTLMASGCRAHIVCRAWLRSSLRAT